MASYVDIISRFNDQGLKDADSGLSKSEGRFEGFAKKAGLAFAAAAGAVAIYAGKLAIDGVKAAIEDEAAQEKLRLTLENVTGATGKTVKAVEDYITATALATGVADDQLRPSLDRLVKATGDVTKAQELQQLALDISAGSGKDLEAVTSALAKAQDGSFTSLKKLGVPLDETITKTKDVDAAMRAAADAFEGQAGAKAETFQGKMDRLNVAFEEAKEGVGGFILDAIQPLVDAFLEKLMPAFEDFGKFFDKNIKPVLEDMWKTFQKDILPRLQDFWNYIQETVIPGLKNTFQPIIEAVIQIFKDLQKKFEENKGKIEEVMAAIKPFADFIFQTLLPIIGRLIGEGLKVLFKWFGFVFDKVVDVAHFFTVDIPEAVKTAQDWFGGIGENIKKAFGKMFEIITAPFKKAFNAIAGFWNKTIGAIEWTVPDWVPLIGGQSWSLPKIPMLAKGGIVTAPTLAMIGEKGPEAVVPLNGRHGLGNTYHITVNGALDPESVARQIQRILKRSELRAGAY